MKTITFSLFDGEKERKVVIKGEGEGMDQVVEDFEEIFEEAKNPKGLPEGVSVEIV